MYTYYFNKLPSCFLLPLSSQALMHQRDAHQVLRGLYGGALLGKNPADITRNTFVFMTSENQSKPVPLWIFGKCQF